jgi:hypothetical protein
VPLDESLIQKNLVKRDINIYLDKPQEKGVYALAWIRQEDYYKIRAAEILSGGTYENKSLPYTQIVNGNFGGTGDIVTRVKVFGAPPFNPSRPFDPKTSICVGEEAETRPHY